MIRRLFSHHLITAFFPWIFFGIFYGNYAGATLYSSAGALVLMIILNFRELRRGFLMPWGSVIFFTFLALESLLGFWTWAEAHALLLANSALAVIVLFSMVIGRPFTLQYAREEVPAELWREPNFLKVNWILTSIWAFLMIVMALPSYFLTEEALVKSWFWNWGLSVICFTAGFLCNLIVPKIWGRKT